VAEDARGGRGGAREYVEDGHDKRRAERGGEGRGEGGRGDGGYGDE
jgi:hypothetical protein